MPGVARDAGRRRVYSELHVGWLELVDRLRRTGMSIRELREYTALVKRGQLTLVQRRDDGTRVKRTRKGQRRAFRRGARHRHDSVLESLQGQSWCLERTDEPGAKLSGRAADTPAGL